MSVILVAGGIQTEYWEDKYKEGSNNTMGVPSIQKLVGEEIETVAGGTKWAPKPSHIYNIHTWELNGTDSGQYEMYFNSSSSLNCYISYLEVVYADAESKPATIEQDLVFCEGEGDHGNGAVITQVWPFEQTRTSWKGGDFPQTVYNTLNHPELQYKFSVQTYNSENWKHTRAGLAYGGTQGDYMAILPVEDYKITYIKIRGGKKKTRYSVQDTAGNIIAGGAEQEIVGSYDKTVEFDLTATSPNTEYRLVLGDNTVTNIREMWITYELVN